jgi:hypothetical protein
MFYRVLADIVVLVHLAWIGFLIAGALWGARRRTVMVVHIGALGYAVLMQVMGWYCPLTHLEFWLRTRYAPGAAWPGSFIAHYAEKLIYLEVTPRLIFEITLVLCALNVWVYLRAWKRSKQPRTR